MASKKRKYITFTDQMDEDLQEVKITELELNKIAKEKIE